MKNYSYVTCLLDDSYVYGVMLLYKTMQKVNTQYPLNVLVTKEVSAPTIEILKQLGLSYKYIDIIETPENIYQHNLKISPRMAGIWKYCWTKLSVYDQTQWDKIVFLDCDVMIMKNLDHLFDMPNGTAPMDGEYSNIWPGRPHFNNGCVVIEPNHEVFEDIFQFAHNIDLEKIPPYITVIADQEILELYFKDWPNQEELHLNKYYDLFGPYLQEAQRQDIADNCYFIHFIGRKPWVRNWARNPNETYDEYWYTVAQSILDECEQEIDWEKVREKLVITVYAICKNEKEFLDRWLAWTTAEADHVCILDTGSTDGTWELLQARAAQKENLIVGQAEINPWRFDVARNKSMELIPKDTNIWFMADLDEVIKEPGWAKDIKDNWTPLFERGRFTYNRQVDEHDNILKQMEEFRVHSRKWHTWINVVHEALINDSKNKYFNYSISTPLHFVVWHYPHKEKQVDYAELCERHLELYPDDALMELQLAIEYEIKKDWENASRHFMNLIKHPVGIQDFELARCCAGIGRILTIKNDRFNALNYYREGRLICPTLFDNYIYAADIFYCAQQYAQAVKLIEEGLKNCHISAWCAIVDIHSFFAHEILGLSYAKLDDLPRAFLHLSLAKHLDSPMKELDDIITDIQKALVDRPDLTVKG